MNFLKKIFSKKNEPKIIVTGMRLESYDRNGNLISDEESKKMQLQWEKDSAKLQIEREKQRIEWQKKIDALKLNKVEPSVWLKNFLEINRKNYERVSFDIIRKLYFQNMNKQLEAQKNKDYRKAYVNSEATLSLLEKFIQSNYEEYGSFEIQTMHAVEFNIKYTAIMGLVGGFENIKEIVNYFPEINFLYKEQLSEYELLLELSKKIRKLIKNNKGILQNTLKKELPDYEPKLITKSCTWMEKFGLLKREKIKNTYKLNLTYSNE